MRKLGEQKANRENRRRLGLCLDCDSPAFRDGKNALGHEHSYCQACYTKRYLRGADEGTCRNKKCERPVKAGTGRNGGKYKLCDVCYQKQYGSRGKPKEELPGVYDTCDPDEPVTEAEIESLRREMRVIWDELEIDQPGDEGVRDLRVNCYADVNFWGESWYDLRETPLML